jgi:hypothetical protein
MLEQERLADESRGGFRQLVRIAVEAIDAVGIEPQRLEVRDLAPIVGADVRLRDRRHLDPQMTVLVERAHAVAIHGERVVRTPLVGGFAAARRAAVSLISGTHVDPKFKPVHFERLSRAALYAPEPFVGPSPSPSEQME